MEQPAEMHPWPRPPDRCTTRCSLSGNKRVCLLDVGSGQLTIKLPPRGQLDVERWSRGGQSVRQLGRPPARGPRGEGERAHIRDDDMVPFPSP